MLFEATVNGERFTGLNICGFSPMKFFTRIFLRYLGQQCVIFFCGTLENHESSAQRIFPRLWYLLTLLQAQPNSPLTC